MKYAYNPSRKRSGLPRRQGSARGRETAVARAALIFISGWSLMCARRQRAF